MSINLGTPAHEAVAALKGNPDFETFRMALNEQAATSALASLGSPIEHRADATAYARALRDLHTFVESAALGVRVNQLPKPRMPAGKAA